MISFRIDWFDLYTVQGTFKESSPAPQFERINSLVLSLPYGPALISIHDYWENHTFHYITLSAKVHLIKAMVFPVSCMDVRVGL